MSITYVQCVRDDRRNVKTRGGRLLDSNDPDEDEVSPCVHRIFGAITLRYMYYTACLPVLHLPYGTIMRLDGECLVSLESDSLEFKRHLVIIVSVFVGTK
jgi:hypothetical protein